MAHNAKLFAVLFPPCIENTPPFAYDRHQCSLCLPWRLARNLLIMLNWLYQLLIAAHGCDDDGHADLIPKTKQNKKFNVNINVILMFSIKTNDKPWVDHKSRGAKFSIGLLFVSNIERCTLESGEELFLSLSFLLICSVFFPFLSSFLDLNRKNK